MTRKFKKQSPLKIGNVGKPDSQTESGISFSLKHLDLNHEKFQVSKDHESEYFKCLMKRLRDVCEMNLSEFKQRVSRSLRNHRIVWEETSEPDGFGVSNNDQREDSWQFSLSANEHGRVHGFFIGSIFFIVWLDKNHSLYS